MPIPIAAMAIGAASPFIARIIGDAFGGGVGAQLAELAKAREQYERVATGGTTQAQAGMSYARARATQELAGQAQRGTAQQRAGLQREAMRTGADVQARYAAQLADLRAREQERAREGVASVQSQIAAVRGGEAQRNRAMVSGAIMGAATPLVASMVTPTAQAGLTPQEAADFNLQQEAARAQGNVFGTPGTTFASGLENRANPFRAVTEAEAPLTTEQAMRGVTPVQTAAPTPAIGAPAQTLQLGAAPVQAQALTRPELMQPSAQLQPPLVEPGINERLMRLQAAMRRGR